MDSFKWCDKCFSPACICNETKSIVNSGFSESNFIENHIEVVDHAATYDQETEDDIQASSTDIINITEIHECNFCFKTFVSADYMNHMKNHLQINTSTCNLCGLNFDNKSDYDYHLCFDYTIEDKNEETSQNTLNIEPLDDITELDNIFISDDNSSKPQKVENHILPDNFFQYECFLCNQLFYILEQYLCHMSRHNNISPNAEKNSSDGQKLECENNIPEVSLINDHSLKLTYYTSNKKLYEITLDIDININSDKDLWNIISVNNNKLACKICKNIFSDMNDLKQHITSHYDIYQYKCKKCDMLFKRVRDFKRHMSNHKRQKFNDENFRDLVTKETNMPMNDDHSSYECDLCEKSFINIDELQLHIHEHTREPIKCDICEDIIENSSEYKKHMKNHVNNELLICEICGENFSTIQMFNQHKEEHLAKTDIQCTICKKKFSAINNLKIHMGVHSSSRPYLCYICGKTFSQLSNHDIHMRMHSGERPFVCNICGKSFSQSGHHKTHMRTHNGLKPFRCTCSKSFSDYGNYIKHARLHSGKLPFNCTVCDKGFTRKKKLEIHMLMHMDVL